MEKRKILAENNFIFPSDFLVLWDKTYEMHSLLDEEIINLFNHQEVCVNYKQKIRAMSLDEQINYLINERPPFSEFMKKNIHEFFVDYKVFSEQIMAEDFFPLYSRIYYSLKTKTPIYPSPSFHNGFTMDSYNIDVNIRSHLLYEFFQNKGTFLVQKPDTYFNKFNSIVDKFHEFIYPIKDLCELEYPFNTVKFKVNNKSFNTNTVVVLWIIEPKIATQYLNCRSEEDRNKILHDCREFTEKIMPHLEEPYLNNSLNGLQSYTQTYFLNKQKIVVPDYKTIKL